MNITIKINTDNAAFEDNDQEITRILIKYAEAINDMVPGEKITMRDINGNFVGLATATK